MVKKRFDGWLIVSVLLLVLFIAVLIYPMFGVIKPVSYTHLLRSQQGVRILSAGAAGKEYHNERIQG